MQRREFIALLGGVAASAPSASYARSCCGASGPLFSLRRMLMTLQMASGGGTFALISFNKRLI